MEKVNYSKLLAATLAGLIIAGAAVLAVQPARSDEVAVEDLIFVCPTEAHLHQLILRKGAGSEEDCGLAMRSEAKYDKLKVSLFGNSYDAWLFHLVEEPTQTLPQVDLSTAKVFNRRAFIAPVPLSFLDADLNEGKALADGTITFGLQLEKFELWPEPPQLPGPTAVASL